MTLLVRLGWRCLYPSRSRDTVLTGLVVGSAVLFGAGIWWGVPEWVSWAPDEVSPADIALAAKVRFSGGWATIYPPFHFAVLAAFHLPFKALGTFGLVDVTGLNSHGDQLIMSRLLSVGMAVGIVALTSAIGREHFGTRAGRLAGAVVAVALPLTYYAKTVNFDVPYVFWVTLAWVFHLRAHRDGRPLWFYFFALAASIAICTKDQAYGFFVLPAVVMGVRVLRDCRHGSSAPAAGIATGRTVAAMAVIALAVAAVGFNIVFNWKGFQEHVHLITGSESTNFQMYPRTIHGYVQLCADAFVQLGQSMSWPLFAAALFGTIASVRAGNAPLNRLLVAALSYFLCFVAVVMYQYDRFFLGVVVILAIVAGWWLDRWVREGVWLRGLRVAMVCLAMVYALTRAIALDALMIRDSRYTTEASLQSIVAPGQTVAGLGLYLIRPSAVPWFPMAADRKALETKRPDFVVVNVGFSLRGESTSPRRQFYESLSNGETSYRRVLRHRTPIPFPLSLERRFQRVSEDPFSNLTKVNPLMEVYTLRESSGSLPELRTPQGVGHLPLRPGLDVR